jgi:hypothetical protein
MQVVVEEELIQVVVVRAWARQREEMAVAAQREPAKHQEATQETQVFLERMELVVVGAVAQSGQAELRMPSVAMVDQEL